VPTHDQAGGVRERVRSGREIGKQGREGEKSWGQQLREPTPPRFTSDPSSGAARNPKGGGKTTEKGTGEIGKMQKIITEADKPPGKVTCSNK